MFKIEGGGPIELKWGNHSENSELVITSEWEVEIKHKDKCSNSKFLEGKFISHPFMQEPKAKALVRVAGGSVTELG